MASAAAAKNTEQEFERNRLRRNTQQFKILPATPTTRRTHSTRVRYPCIRTSVVATDAMIVSFLTMSYFF